MENLTIEQAYRSMYYFLDKEYHVTQNNEVGGLLGSLSWEIFVDSGPADPAVWQEWLDAVELSINHQDIKKNDISNIQAFNAMYQFLKNEYNLTKSEEWIPFLQKLEEEVLYHPNFKATNIWVQWLEAIKIALETDENASPHGL